MALEQIGQATMDIAAIIRQRHPEAFSQACRTSSDTDTRCPKCKGFGFIALGNARYRDCECQEAKRAKYIIDQSGLSGALELLTMENYQHDKPFQVAMFDSAQSFLSDTDSWLYLGGQPGCGKTHLCTAVCGELLKRGTPVRYMLWADEVRRIKAPNVSLDDLDEMLEPLKHIKVLYIDDLFKGVPMYEGRLSPTDADKKLAFEIFNHRYVTGLRTIISCEWDIKDLIDIEQGTFSRVYERSRKHMVHVAPDKSKNWRLK